MKVTRKYPKKSKFNNFYIKIIFKGEYSWWSPDEIVFIIHGTDEKLSGFHIIENKSNSRNGKSSLVYYSKSIDDCKSKESELLVRQQEFEKSLIIEKEKLKIKKLKEKHQKELISKLEDLKEESKYYIEEINEFWENTDSSPVDNNLEDLKLLVEQAKRKVKFKNLVNE